MPKPRTSSPSLSGNPSVLFSISNYPIHAYRAFSQRIYLSLNDLASPFLEDTELLINAWFSQNDVLEYLHKWEKNYNPAYKRNSSSQALPNTSIKSWIINENALGIFYEPHRNQYFAHLSHALLFSAWLSSSYFYQVFRSCKIALNRSGNSSTGS